MPFVQSYIQVLLSHTIVKGSGGCETLSKPHTDSNDDKTFRPEVAEKQSKSHAPCSPRAEKSKKPLASCSPRPPQDDRTVKAKDAAYPRDAPGSSSPARAADVKKDSPSRREQPGKPDSTPKGSSSRGGGSSGSAADAPQAAAMADAKRKAKIAGAAKAALVVEFMRNRQAAAET